jgi:hypothetical protein
LQTQNLLLELFPAFDWSKALYGWVATPKPQELTIAKGVRQGEDCENGAGSPAAFDYQDALKASRAGVGPSDSRIDSGTLCAQARLS